MIIKGRVVDAETGELRIGMAPPVIILVNTNDLAKMISTCDTLRTAMQEQAEREQATPGALS